MCTIILLIKRLCVYLITVSLFDFRFLVYNKMQQTFILIYTPLKFNHENNITIEKSWIRFYGCKQLDTLLIKMVSQ